MKYRFNKLLLILLLGSSRLIDAQTNVDILVVGAGGGGGAHKNSLANTGGGGGGGVVHLTSSTLNRGTYTVTVAPTTSGRVNGSSDCNGVGPNGGNSSFTISGGITITPFGGGGGGGCNTANGQSGGSGGGGHGGHGCCCCCSSRVAWRQPCL
jgi:hypothetical protein